MPPTTNGRPTIYGWKIAVSMADFCFLGNITRVQNLRGFLRGLQGEPGPRFPILLEEVLYDGTHTGDWVPKEHTAALQQEVDTVLQSIDILTESEKEFFEAMKRLCAASMETGNPILF